MIYLILILLLGVAAWLIYYIVGLWIQYFNPQTQYFSYGLPVAKWIIALSLVGGLIYFALRRFLMS